ncbi:uncharacterized protein LOC143024956 isoform X2 [Oratosquilla oratoria]|uniref:uncharacterized protein LOC143024956 isoform X2 n=1 Tax=Oratosquilla oratoria TaxID=337810 RepID=UPI003F76D846
MDKVGKVFVVVLVCLGVLMLVLLAIGVYADGHRPVNAYEEEIRTTEDILRFEMRNIENDGRKTSFGEERSHSHVDDEKPVGCGNGTLNELPWVTFMRGSSFICLGVLISPQHILLDAECSLIGPVTHTLGDRTFIRVKKTFFPLTNVAKNIHAGNNLYVVTLEKPLSHLGLEPACLPLATMTDTDGLLFDVTIIAIHKKDCCIALRDREVYSPEQFRSVLYDMEVEKQEKIKSIDYITSKHLGIIHPNPREILGSFLMYQDNFGLMHILGIGPISVEPELGLLLYTNVASHLPWLRSVLEE